MESPNQPPDRPLGTPSPIPAQPPLFKRVVVGKCHRQTANDRFGAGAKAAVHDRERQAQGQPPLHHEIPFLWPGQETHDDEHNGLPRSIYTIVPSMQTWRNNLTTLCQTYNLYLVAYQGRIFVYQPRSVAAQLLPREPSIQLIPDRSKHAERVPGYLDPRHPHTINHLVTGFLGSEEIAVACYDDGDVVAYYMRDVEAAITSDVDLPVSSSAKRRTNRSGFRNGKPMPFLHDNVGMTAWGLAVHQKSRLIAVSSNRHEVTIFAPAFARDRGHQRKDPAEQDDGSIESRVRMRARNWRIVIFFSPEAKNMPNICFTDDDSGHAEKVCAVDIDGSVWLADIWRTCQPPTLIRPPRSSDLLCSEENYPQSSRGWGLALLPNSSFMTVRSVSELLGTSTANVPIRKGSPSAPHPIALTRKALQEIPDDPIHSVRVRMNDGRAAIFQGAPPHMMPPPHPVLLLAAGPAEGTGLLGLDGWEDGAEADAVSDEDMDSEWEQQLEDGINQIMGEDIDGQEVDSEDAEDAEDDEEQEDAQEPGTDEDEDQDDGDGVENGEINDIPANEGLATNPGQLPALGVQDMISAQPGIGSLLQLPGNLTNTSVEYVVPMYWGLIDAIEQSHNDPFSWSQSASPVRTKRFTKILEKPSPRAEQKEPFLWDSFQGLQDMVFFPHNGFVCRAPQQRSKLGSLLRQAMDQNKSASVSQGYAKRSKVRYTLVRAYEKDLEMRQVTGEQQDVPQEIGVVCQDAAVLGRFPDHDAHNHFRATSRLSMMHHIPELALLIVGSPTGRVLLVTLTRMKNIVRQENIGCWWDHGFRVDWVLPRKPDEDVHRKEARPLYGMAVGPVQTANGVGPRTEEEGLRLPRRYRLVLHYRTHDILTYEITREEQTGRLCIF